MMMTEMPIKILSLTLNTPSQRPMMQQVSITPILVSCMICCYQFCVVETSVNNVEVLVNLPFILMLKDFAMASIKPLISPDKITESEGVELEDAGVLLSPAPVSPAESETFSPAAAKESSTIKSSEETATQGNVTITAKIKKPLIALVEDAEDNDSIALVLSVSNP